MQNVKQKIYFINLEGDNMSIENISDPINISKSETDSRSLIMPHQQEAVEAMTKYFALEEDKADRNGIVVMPTGSGKTFTAVTWLLSQGVANGYRVVWLVHRQELVEQTFREFRKQAPILKGTGIDKLRILPISGAHFNMATANKADVYVCSIASVANKYGYRFIERMLGAAGKRKVIVVVDEAHHAVAANYQKVIKRITSLNPNRNLLGLTATPIRMQDAEQKRLQAMFNISQNLAKKKGIHGYVYEVTLKQLLVSGFLAKPIYERVNTKIIGEVEYDCTPEDEAFFVQYGELSEKLKNQIANSSARNTIILKQYLDNKEKYGKTLIFAVNQMHAETLCDEFKKEGISCDYVISSRPGTQDIIQSFKNNKIKILINVQILTEGSDVPDIETVFLTRQTNSDSLLMQMIGRGLRGEKAGGTESANIVAFHDTWNTFAHWLDPGALDIFIPDLDDEDLEESEEKIEIEPNEVMIELLKKLADNGVDEDLGKAVEGEQTADVQMDISQRDLYLKLYRLMRASLTSNSEVPIYPCGWYSVIDEEGNEAKMLVFDCQQSAYRNIERNLSLIKGKLDIDGLKALYFDECEIQPDEDEIDYFLEYIKDMDGMPPYFTFEQREALDPQMLAETVNRLYEKESDKEEWLKKLYDSAPVLQQIYKYFYAFKKTIFDAMKIRVDAMIEIDDIREEYKIVEDYYNLSELLEEVKQMYPKLRVDGLAKIAWSDTVVRAWYAYCQRLIKDKEILYQIHVNKLLSSPKVDREVIKYLIFHELLHENGYWSHDEEFRKREWEYPNSVELDGFLDSLNLEYNTDAQYMNSTYFVDPPFITKEIDSNIEETKVIDADTNSLFNPSAKGVQKETKYCRNCGNKLPISAKFCDKCGADTNY